YLEPNGRFGKRDEFGQFGAQIMMDGDRIVVGYVAAGTPAAASGLQEGDVVSEINGRDAASLSIDDIFPLLEDSPAGTEITLRVSRAGSSHDVKVKMAPTL
ncbi:MAG TPA: PDZ domain-containing protein, partial [Candidatus Eisenbacteria bacterium]|nr:PDZ domain-containing protein [Candidatus Eisenbacteria bacterium]